MDIISYGVASKASKEERQIRNNTLGEGITGSFPTMKERIDNIDGKISNVTKQADKLIINNAVNIMKAHAKLNAVAQTKKYNMHQMIFDDLLDLSGIDGTKSTGYTHDAVLGEITANSDCVIETKTEDIEEMPKKIILCTESPAIGKIDLSGGVNNSGTRYTAPNGVTVVSSVSRYVNEDYYYISNLFEESINRGPYTYWLTRNASSYTLTFDFGSIGNPHIDRINVYPRTRDDTSSNYRILVSDDGTNYEEVVPWVINTHDNNTPYGTVRTHDLYINKRYLQFELIKKGSWGASLSEIEFFRNTVSSLGDYYISRNNGEAWEKIIPNTLHYFDDKVSSKGNQLKLKAELPEGTKLLNYALTWA